MAKPCVSVKVYLHADNGVYEEQHNNKQCDIWKSLEGFNEGPE